jgi:hypothetical protein
MNTRERSPFGSLSMRDGRPPAPTGCTAAPSAPARRITSATSAAGAGHDAIAWWLPEIRKRLDEVDTDRRGQLGIQRGHGASHVAAREAHLAGIEDAVGSRRVLRGLEDRHRSRCSPAMNGGLEQPTPW